jgi:regulator of sigma E protease
MFGSVLVFFIILSVLILVHELGHFWAARRAGVLVEEFGFGLPPKIISRKIGETIYSINLLPLGGFVRLHGESGEEGVVDSKRAFINKSKRERVTIILTGVVMNFLLAIVAFSIVYSFSGIPREGKVVRVVGVTSGSPAQIAGVLVGDRVRKMDGKEVLSIEQFINLIEEKRGEKITLEVEREKPSGKVVKIVSMVPREKPPKKEGPLGVVITTTEIYYPPIWLRPFVGIYYGLKEALLWGGTVVLGFIKIFKDLFSGIGPKDVAGPVGIFAISSQVAQAGVLAVINFIGILSVNLAILNIIPFPALDGGRLLFIGIESIFGKRVLPKVESIIHTIGMIVLLILLFAITVHDIKRLIVSGGISGFLETVLR